VVAYFNFPQRLENEAQAACDAALAIVRRADDFGRVCAEHGVEPCRFSIGIAVGPAIIGNMGSGSRLHFTPLGDVMGVAARNERAAKESGRLIVADRYCAEHAAQCRFEPLGESHFSLVPPPV
jgi:adenylate cyclase